MSNRTLVSILNYNGTEDTIACLKSFYLHEKPDKYVIVIWDNGSKASEILNLEKYIGELDLRTASVNKYEYDNLKILQYNLVLVKSDENYGFAIANNKVIRPFLGCFSYYIMLNNDTVFRENVTSKCIDYMDGNLRIGVLTTAIYYYDKNQIWNAGGKFLFGWRKYYTEREVRRLSRKGVHTLKVDYITGCYMIIRDNILDKYGLFSEKFFFGEEDYNYCMRLKKNDVNLCVRTDLELYHKVGASVSRDANLDRLLRNTFVHYLNRYIDMKEFYSKSKWRIWRIISSFICLRMALKITRFNVLRSIEFVSKLFKYSKNDRVDKKQFEKIIGGGII